MIVGEEWIPQRALGKGVVCYVMLCQNLIAPSPSRDYELTALSLTMLLEFIAFKVVPN